MLCAGDISLICSDVMARGMDLPSVDLVVNYDATPFLRTYIHRIGRTARAGRSGTAISLLKGKEVRHFKEMLWKAQNATLQPFPTIAPDTLKPMVPLYTVCNHSPHHHHSLLSLSLSLALCVCVCHSCIHTSHYYVVVSLVTCHLAARIE